MKLFHRVTEFVKTWKSPLETIFLREIGVTYRLSRYLGKVLDNPYSTADLARDLFPDNAKEYYIVFYLDHAYRTIGYSRLAGTASGCLGFPREIFQCAVLCGAVRVTLAHSYPNRDFQSTEQDRERTRNLMKAGRLMGIPVEDQVLVGPGEDYESISQYWADEWSESGFITQNDPDPMAVISVGRRRRRSRRRFGD